MAEKKLTAKQLAFIEAYLSCWNAKDAAIAAGYPAKSAKQVGYENLTKPYLWKLVAERLKTMAMSADEVLARMAAQARGDLPTLERDTPLGAVEERDTLHALELIGKHHKLFSDRVEHTATVHIDNLDAMLELVYGSGSKVQDE